ncbi:mucin-associated surface protein (MASP), putative [Trypanosoma cruzi marinkellei]|uniref:Mucin-associated surface protein (MASP), putative n=1 Tax=Trypanosoma cruzi marinkellei TaxID=85056 RepID=K2N2N6_TRYCR|nr:mucin-associated surface protein (MASP), putative [Trypanosoma cruzi marinkellei]
MMMTGRVLLVCALCVLWCGIAGGGIAVVAVDGAELRREEKSDVAMSVSQVVEAQSQGSQDSVRQLSEKNNELSVLNEEMNSVPQGGKVSQSSTKFQGTGEELEGKEKEGGKVKALKDTRSTEQTEELRSLPTDSEMSLLTSPSPELKGPPPPPPILEPSTTIINGNTAGNTNATSGRELISSEDGPNQEHLLKPPTSESPATTLPVQNENTSVADILPVQQTKEAQHDMELESASENEESVLTTVNQNNQTTEINVESTPTSPSANKSAITNNAEKSNDEEIPKHDEAPDGETKKKVEQNENKEENTDKKTTVVATSITNNITTPGDSDGSTAASHTTSPLLLLLVACAVAVVAA